MAETPFRRIKAVWEPVKARVGVQVKVPAVVMAGEQAAGPVEVPDKDEADALRISIFNRHSTCVISQEVIKCHDLIEQVRWGPDL
jgi:hypothetical protein